MATDVVRLARFVAVHKSVYGPSRRFAAVQQFGSFPSEAEIQRAALTEPELCVRA